MGTRDLTAYSPRLLLQWEADAPSVIHRAVEGTLVFADVSGFTRLSERLARASGRAGAEEMADIINALFDDLLTCAALRGGEMLKYGGDAALLFFRGDDHAPRAVAGAHDMQQRLRAIGRVETRTGPVRLRMSVGMHTGTFDLFKVGRRHQELIVAGPATTETVRMEAAADAGEILLSPSTAAVVAARNLGAEKEGGRLLRGTPTGPMVDIVPAVPSPHADRFVAPDLGGYLAGDVDPDHRLATVAFIHIMGIDRLLPEVGAEAVAAWLDETMSVVQTALADFGVTFLATDLAADGTKVMAASGAPLAGEDAERRMLLALRRMVDAGTPLPIRAGANRGHVFAASLGPKFRQTYTTLGDVTNTAARVMGKAGEGEVLTLAAVLDHVRTGVDAAELAPFAAKGKTEPLVPFRVDAVLDRVEADAPVARLPLTGRDLELQTLLGAVESVRAGTGALVELVGDVGSGKSRLVEEVLTQATDLRPLIVRCEPYERTTPFHPIKRLLAQLVPADADGLTALVDERAPALSPWLPLIASVLDVPIDETDETRVLDERFRLERTAAVTVDLLQALLDAPTFIVVEDVHWLDDASASVLRRMESGVAGSPWLVCATCRNEPSSFVPTDRTALVQLAPLGDSAMTALVAAATTDAPLPPHVRTALVERAAGNPLFLTELLDHGVAGEALPESVEAVMAAQIDRLAPEARRLLRHAAVLGSRFGVDLLAEISGEPGLAPTSARQMASRLGWMVVPDGDGKLRFRHQLVRDVAYESLPFRVRRDLHGRAGDAIERRGGSEEGAGVLSLHFFHARRFDDCWTQALIAAERAGRKHANVEAVELLERALAAARHVTIADSALAIAYEELAVRQSALGNSTASKIALRASRRHARGDAVLLARLFNREARIREREGDTERVFRWIRRGLKALAHCADDAARAERAELFVFYGWTKLYQGHARQAERWFGRGLDEAEAARHRWAIAGASLGLDNVDVALGRVRDPERARRAVAIYDELGELGDQAMVLINLGSDAVQQSRWAEALDLNRRGRDLMARTGNLVEAAYGSFNMAEVLIDQGHLDEAEAILDEVETLWRAVDHSLGLAYIESHRGRVSAQRGEYEAALQHLRAADAAYSANGLDVFAIDVRGRAAECMVRTGAIEEAMRVVADALIIDMREGGSNSTSLLLRARAACRHASGDIEGARADFDASLVTARQRGLDYDVLVVLDQLASLGWGNDASVERDELQRKLGVVRLPPPPVTQRPATV